jgi:NTE family protein
LRARSYRVALVLGGGNALGAYHAGLYEALVEAAIEPDWVLGTSIGAVTGAIIAGNTPGNRLARLRDFWRPGEQRGWPLPWVEPWEEWRRTAAVAETLVAGRPGLFGPLGSTAGWWPMDRGGTSALYDTQAMDDTFARLIDFDLLNGGGPRFTVAAVDIETGDEVLMDSARQRICADHIRASAALLTAFPAVEVDGRLLGDGGLAMNLPLDPVMADEERTPILCIAADLLPLTGSRPKTIGEVMGRMQDVVFAAQSRRTLARWQAVFDAGTERDARSVTLVTAVYTDQGQEVAGKAMDFSPPSIAHRWVSGREDGLALVRRLRSGEIAIGTPGLSVHRSSAS